MELFLFLTIILSLPLSFFMSKLLSMASTGHTEHDSASRSSWDAMEKEVTFKRKIAKRVRFSDEVSVRHVDEFEFESEWVDVNFNIQWPDNAESEEVSGENPAVEAAENFVEEYNINSREENKSGELGRCDGVVEENNERTLFQEIDDHERALFLEIENHETTLFGEFEKVLIEAELSLDKSAKEVGVLEWEGNDIDDRVNENEVDERGLVGALDDRVDKNGNGIERIKKSRENDEGSFARSAEDEVFESEGTGRGDIDGSDLGLFDSEEWEGIESSELEKLFGAAVAFVGCRKSDVADCIPKLGADLQMHLLGLHKVATQGPCDEPQPMALKLSARSKWNAWQRLGNMSPEEAMDQYISLVSKTIPEWNGDDPEKK